MTQTILAKSTWNTLRFLNAIKRDTLLWVNMECSIWKRWFTLPPSPSDNVGTPLQHNETFASEQHCMGERGEFIYTRMRLSVPRLLARIVWVNCKIYHLISRFALYFKNYKRYGDQIFRIVYTWTYHQSKEIQ